MECLNNAEKTLIHISHLHPLKLVTSPEPRPICHACNMSCAGQSYGCIDCRYFLHVTCATIRRCMDHSSHPAHTLVMALNRPFPGNFTCDACGEDGNHTFLLGCRECDFDLHLHCAALPHIVNHPSHSHPLSIVYKNPFPSGTVASCDLCKNNLDPCKWFYLCRSCNLGGHVGCFSHETPEVLSPGLQPPVMLGSNILMNTLNNMQQEQLLFAQAKAAQTMMVGSANLVNSFQWKNNLL